MPQQLEKIIRTLCYFTADPGDHTLRRLEQVSQQLIDAGFQVQTKRVVSTGLGVDQLVQRIADPEVLLGAGPLSLKQAQEQLPALQTTQRVAFYLPGDEEPLSLDAVDWLWALIQQAPHNTFNFSYGFNIPFSSPFFPAARYQRDGFALGLQPTNLATGCTDLAQWLQRMASVWAKLIDVFGKEEDFLGLDSSVAPLFAGDGSLVEAAERLGGGFQRSILSPFFVQLSHFVAKENPRPVGLCGLMFPGLEDFSLAQLYEKGEFSLERNLFLALHSGLGVDTYPIGIDEDRGKVLRLLNLIRALSHKHRKPLAARFISDGKTAIGQRSDFASPYLQDVTIRPI